MVKSKLILEITVLTSPDINEALLILLIMALCLAFSIAFSTTSTPKTELALQAAIKLSVPTPQYKSNILSLLVTFSLII